MNSLINDLFVLAFSAFSLTGKGIDNFSIKFKSSVPEPL